ncbi:hypothetical protein [Methylocella tundrae]|uniref:Uncharacterized protein n=1 Tax=Methylocella tundrae TaxID=227605 RepID=A0A4U8YVU3_METTU|nr:hypothetical protein [Methylocella tundrae]WPP05523.1 hypothetical protein SIN04_06775 [Methylocella tundrae]VFU07950.1 protein of unknown function [Methylocella tundrae]
MTDTVVVTTPDATPAVLQPTLTDAIAAALAYSLSAGESALASAASAATSASAGATAAAAASAALVALVGVANGIAGLDGSRFVPLAQIAGLTDAQISATAAISGAKINPVFLTPVSINRSGGAVLTIGNGSTGGATPTRLNFDTSYSTVPGANPKLSMFGSAGDGFGVSASALDYMVAGGHAHNFYVNGSKVGSLAATGISSIGVSVAPPANSLSQAFASIQSLSGILAGNPAFNANWLKLSSDTLDVGGGFVQGLLVEQHFGGAGTKGGRQTILSAAFLVAPTDAANTNRNYVSLSASIEAASGDGGSLGSEKGALFASNFVAIADAGATHLLDVTGSEVDIIMRAGSSSLYKWGWDVVSAVGDAVHGSLEDAAFNARCDQGAIGWMNAFQVSTAAGTAPTYGVSPGGTILYGGVTASVALRAGIDLSGVSSPWVQSAIVLPANNGGIWWGTGFQGGSIVSVTAANGGGIIFDNDVTIFNFGASEPVKVTPAGLQIPGSLIVATLPPATSSSIGAQGQITWDATHIYVCVSSNTWVRALLSTF